MQRAALENIAKVLKTAGSGLEHIVKANVYLTDMGNFSAMNEIYAQVCEHTIPYHNTYYTGENLNILRVLMVCLGSVL